MSRVQQDPGDVVGENGPQPSEFDKLIDRPRSIRLATAEYLGVDPEQIYKLLRHKWRPAKGEAEFTNAELTLAMAMIPKYDLDPMAKEIYLARGQGKLMIIVAVDGWIKIVHRAPGYDGHSFDMHFDEEGNLEWVDCTIYSTVRSHPETYRGFMKEYMALGGFMKGKIPWHMLRLFAFRHAARFFAPIGGVVTEEEAHWMGNETPQQAPADDLDALADRLNSQVPADAHADLPDEVKPAEEIDPAHTAKQKKKARGWQSPAEPDEDPAAADSQLLRGKLLAKIANGSEQQVINAENDALEAESIGDLLPADCETVTSACRRRFKEMKKG